MSKYLAASGILTLSAFALLTAAESRAEDLKKLTALCESNPSCTHKVLGSNGATSFRVQHGTKVIVIKCSAGSHCVRRHSRGQYATVTNTTALLSLR
jgi:hypothetical protein